MKIFDNICFKCGILTNANAEVVMSKEKKNNEINENNSDSINKNDKKKRTAKKKRKVIIRVTPVSYTHLDVYKRQLIFFISDNNIVFQKFIIHFP